MTIVIPYRDEVHDGLELKYALRSIDKCLTGWSEVLIIGDRPAWYKGSVTTFRDLPGRKEFNIYSKILAACADKLVTDDFLMWNDDHFLLRSLHVKDIKHWHGRRIRIGISKARGSYGIKLRKTGNEFPGNNFDIHVPIVYNKGKFGEIFSTRSDEICIKSAYCNSLGITGEYMEDCKIDGQVSEAEIKRVIAGRLFFSSGTSICNGMVNVLAGLYPGASRWEIPPV